MVQAQEKEFSFARQKEEAQTFSIGLIFLFREMHVLRRGPNVCAHRIAGVASSCQDKNDDC